MTMIGGLAREAGVSVETIRYYQRRGLLATPQRPGGNSVAGGARRYGELDSRRLHFIRAAQAAGFTLEQILELLRLDASDDRHRVRQLARERIGALDRKIAELITARAVLENLATECEASAAGKCPIIAAFTRGS